MEDKHISLLHIEDDNVDKMVVERVLRKLNLVGTLHHAANGEDALSLLRGEGGFSRPHPFPQVILLDINMPRMNGIEFLKELRQDEALKHLSVYMVTTSNDDQDVRNAHAYNVAGYILKPVDIQQFENTFKILGSYWQICEFPA
jgi:CheY-like chemotaxis protein